MPQSKKPTQKRLKKEPYTVISLGGSIIVPDAIDTKFLRAFRDLIRDHIKQGRRFVIISGGGKTARRYMSAAETLTALASEDIDWLGIHSTRLNGHLIRTLFRKEACPTIIKDPRRKITATHPVIVAAGWKPGRSTDYVATCIAKNLGAKKLINLSNVDFAYDKDPREHKDAKPIKTSSWKDFRALLPKKWDPGLSAPFDPIAAREAEKLGLEVAIINGRKLKEVGKYLAGEPFKGTIVTD
ncbi:UMP kinase [Candidatus Kaiserbacteria bacterium CG10_big_fil_rev_8_21_14_0_10_45_20]|uniref:UMP kinase n=1 Tax=Candidatus Kaiserbacteria bacterium CG10_big_fil_rev_8_21_14_0_10_45_20 TaxID=1974607 RepID=A0A2H0UG65_9BACT|nr:MAG: UMP kinase [Candidatus Kaiserbacteria bacterium CG10_big_fil_rev_8_21_14_0_10_45_20]